jgi:hypothetical protein
MNARPLRRFLFRLAGFLHMTVGELCERMDSHELSEWIAYERHFHGPLGDEWRQTGTVAAAILAPYVRRGQAPKVTDFIPVEKPPQHKTQMEETLTRMAEAFAKKDSER